MLVLSLALCAMLPLAYVAQVAPHCHDDHPVTAHPVTAAETGHKHPSHATTSDPLHHHDDCGSDADHHHHELCQSFDAHLLTWAAAIQGAPQFAPALAPAAFDTPAAPVLRIRVALRDEPLPAAPPLPLRASRAPPLPA
jgi:hypothetical protein